MTSFIRTKFARTDLLKGIKDPADALGDLDYVVEGARLALGVNGDSRMGKADGR